ncbi:hypothetical protein MMC30_006663 [Trapelia coarctata]|nr:hypothetical protein [Trapelia coarctata]
MKAGIFTFLAVALLQLTVAQPHGLRQKHRHHLRQATDNQVDWYIEEVIVYVDSDGKPVSTTTIIEKAPKTSSTPTPAALPSTAAPVQPTTFATSTSTPAAPAPPASSPVAPPSPASTAAAPVQSSSPPSQGAGFGPAIAYSPYNNDGTCKGLSQVTTDLASMASYQVIRLYEPACNQIANVIAATKGKNVQIIAGVLGLDNGQYSPSLLQKQVDDLISQVNGNWGVINTVNIGNELVNAGKTSTSEVVSRVNQYRQELRSKGYNGPVVTVDTMVAMRSNIELCTASDYCAINCHAFYDGNVLPDGAGKFVLDFVQQISSLAGGKTTVVTESGWPSQGPSIGKAVASPENQKAAVASLKTTFSNNLVLYNAYNNLWFSDPSLQYWGIYGAAPAQGS